MKEVEQTRDFFKNVPLEQDGKIYHSTGDKISDLGNVVAVPVVDEDGSDTTLLVDRRMFNRIVQDLDEQFSFKSGETNALKDIRTWLTEAEELCQNYNCIYGSGDCEPTNRPSPETIPQLKALQSEMFHYSNCVDEMFENQNPNMMLSVDTAHRLVRVAVNMQNILSEKLTVTRSYVRGAIVAMTSDQIIGKANKIPWHYPEDLRRFKQRTLNSAVIMGRETWESLNCKRLPGRRNIVIGRLSIRGEAEQYYTIREALDTCDNTDVWFIGGWKIYRDAMKYIDILDITFVPDKVEGKDVVRFPEVDWSKWEVIDDAIIGVSKNLVYRRIHSPLSIANCLIGGQ